MQQQPTSMFKRLQHVTCEYTYYENICDHIDEHSGTNMVTSVKEGVFQH